MSAASYEGDAVEITIIEGTKPEATFSIPQPVWDLGLIPEAITAPLEGAMVHAQLLARPGVHHHGTALSQTELGQTPTQGDLGVTIKGIRSRIWSIHLDQATQDKILEVILGILDNIEDPVGRAAAIYLTFDSRVSVQNKGVPKSALNRYSLARVKIAQALAWESVVSVTDFPWHTAYIEMLGRVTPEFLIKLGAPAKQLTKALEIERGLDLIIVAATARWMREVIALDTVHFKAGPEYSYSSLSELKYGSVALTSLYGISELHDPKLSSLHQRYVKAAITRLTAYKSDFQKRVKRRQGGNDN